MLILTFTNYLAKTHASIGGNNKKNCMFGQPVFIFQTTVLSSDKEKVNSSWTRPQTKAAYYCSRPFPWDSVIQELRKSCYPDQNETSALQLAGPFRIYTVAHRRSFIGSTAPSGLSSGKHLWSVPANRSKTASNPVVFQHITVELREN